MKKLFGSVLLASIVSVAINVIIIYAVASLITSMIKKGSRDCGTTYGIEKHYIDGDFFCKE